MEKSSIRLVDVSKLFNDQESKEEFAAVDHINLEIKAGEFFTLLGPSGCGKTTTLRLIAGFEIPDTGQVFINDQDCTNIPPYRRPVHTVFQNYALFPHMSVADNVAYSLKIQRVPKAEREERVRDSLAMVQLAKYGKRRPSQLSGGQQQRVALARALVNNPAVLLLDEPLGALDLRLRKEMQWELKQLQQRLGISFLYVTHDQEEALTMSDRIAVMSDGYVIQVGTPEDIYQRPNTHFVASFIGETNLLNTEVVNLGNEKAVVRIGELVVEARMNQPADKSDELLLGVRPEKVQIYSQGNVSEGKCILPARVTSRSFIGTDLRYRLTLEDGQAITALVRQNGQPEGSNFAQDELVQVGFSPEDTYLLSK